MGDNMNIKAFSTLMAVVIAALTVTLTIMLYIHPLQIDQSTREQKRSTIQSEIFKKVEFEEPFRELGYNSYFVPEGMSTFTLNGQTYLIYKESNGHRGAIAMCPLITP